MQVHMKMEGAHTSMHNHANQRHNCVTQQIEVTAHMDRHPDCHSHSATWLLIIGQQQTELTTS